MRRRLGLALACTAIAAATAFAQPSSPRRGQPPTTPRGAAARAADQEPPPPPPPPPVASSGPRRQGQPVNIKVEFTITDQRGTSAPLKRTVSIVVADAHTGMIRSQAVISTGDSIPLNIDTSPELLSDGKVRLGFNVQYDFPALQRQTPESGDSGGPATPALMRGTVNKTSLHDSVALILESGKPMIAAQSADPIGERQVTVEVKATVLK